MNAALSADMEALCTCHRLYYTGMDDPDSIIVTDAAGNGICLGHGSKMDRIVTPTLSDLTHSV